MSEHDDDVALLRAWRLGDRQAGARLVDLHFAAVHRFFARRAPERADDLAQQVFLRAASSSSAPHRDGSLRAYFLQSARNMLVDTHRRDAIGERVLANLETPSSMPSPSTMAHARQQHRLLLVALRRLPEDLQITLELFYWEHLTTHEVATVLGIAAGTVKWRLSEARRRLVTEIHACASDVELARITEASLERWAASVRSRIER